MTPLALYYTFLDFTEGHGPLKKLASWILPDDLKGPQFTLSSMDRRMDGWMLDNDRSQ